jgi:hypothetical protein
MDEAKAARSHDSMRSMRRLPKGLLVGSSAVGGGG